MKYIAFRKLPTPPLFTPQDLRNLGIALHPNELTRWIKQGYITKLRGGLYTHTDTIQSLPRECLSPYLVSPSYLSLAHTLSHHGMIPEAVFTFTAITTKPTRTYSLPQGHFTYQHLPSRLFFGYHPVTTPYSPYYLAEPEKALLDFFYLNPYIKNSKDLAELRLNLNNLDWVKLKLYLKIFKHERLNYLIKILETTYAHT